MPAQPASSMQSMQEQHYNEDVSYLASPHLRHAELKAKLVAAISGAAHDVSGRGLPLKVLEVGAGHGGYTESALALGADVTAIEMSRPSLAVLDRRFGINPNFHGVFDEHGSLDGAPEGGFGLVLAVAVLHHIPDYVAALATFTSRLMPGGSLLTLQDPLWYDRVPAIQHRGERAAYLTWRIAQGELRTGTASLIRRLRNSYDDSKPGDMVEYHVVRNGVDEVAVQDALRPHFEKVELLSYWSTALPSAQQLGTRWGWHNTFGVHATGYRPGGAQ